MDPQGTTTTETERAESDDEFLLAKEETAYQVYKGLWKDFYDWEQEYCRQTLQGLKEVVVRPEEFPLDDSSDSDYESNEYTEWFTFENCDGKLGSVCHDALSLELILQEEVVSPYPSYITCTPSSTNVQHSKNFMDKALFTPFSDDPRFKTESYLSLFNSYGWQTDFWDPDREMIFLEVARRLHHGHGFTYSEIDNLRIYNVPLQIHGSAGMIWEATQRDRLLWPGSQMSILPEITTQGTTFNLNFEEDVTKGIIAFCSNLNCIKSACLLHDESHPVINLKPSMTSKDLRLIHSTLCNRDCFKSYLETDAEIELLNLGGSWDEKDVSTFLSVIKFAPDSSPCDLAVICRKPCVEAYVHQCKHIFDDVVKAVEEGPLIPEPLRLEFEFEEDHLHGESKNASSDRVKQCYHPGLCDQYSNCTCYDNHQRCQRTCRCSKTCNLRFKGCECLGTKPCGDANNCACQRAGRECDPELCTACDARNSKVASRTITCQNATLQRGQFPRIWIHSSHFGLGAFAMNPLGPGKCVAEYVGEYVHYDLNLALDIIRRFLHRNYSFGLTQGLSLDSFMLGNVTRYLNHSKNSNCYAKLVMVNGDLKIGIYTADTIKQKGELFLDYGEDFWKEHAESEDGNTD